MPQIHYQKQRQNMMTIVCCVIVLLFACRILEIKIILRMSHVELRRIICCHLMNDLSTTLTHLKFGREFNQKVDNLSNTLTHLTFGYCFKQNVDNLPTSLINVSVSCDEKRKLISQFIKRNINCTITEIH